MDVMAPADVRTAEPRNDAEGTDYRSFHSLDSRQSAAIRGHSRLSIVPTQSRRISLELVGTRICADCRECPTTVGPSHRSRRQIRSFHRSTVPPFLRNDEPPRLMLVLLLPAAEHAREERSESAAKRRDWVALHRTRRPPQPL